MKPLLFGSVIGLVVVAMAASDAIAQNLPTDYRRSMGNLRPDHRTAAPAVQGSPPPVRTRRMPTVVVQPYYTQPYVQQYYGGYTCPHYYGHRHYRPYRYRRPMYYGPVFVPAQALYGPQAVMRFMGVR